MKHYLYSPILSALLFLITGTACTSEITDRTTPATGTPVEVVATICTAPVETRAAIRNDDKISYSEFEAGDAIGIFADGGLNLRNIKLTHQGSSFKAEGDNSEFIWQEGDAKNVYAYYPFPATNQSIDEDATNYPVTIWRKTSTVENKTWNAGFEDFLAASVSSIPNGALISLGFTHQFAMLIIERGAGFESPSSSNGGENKDDVKITLNHKISKQAKIISENSKYSYRLYQDASGEDVVTANKGKFTPAGNKEANNCYYVLIPVGDVYGSDDKKLNTPLTVSSITLYNKAGIKMTVPFSMSAAKFVSNYKYRVIVEMRNNQAVIEPEEICRWDEEEIPLVIPPGIENAENFNEWMSTYNTAETEDNKEARNKTLGKYGTYDGDTRKWTFLLLGDMDLSELNDKSMPQVITTFADNFDGQGHTLTGLKLSGSGNCGFFATLSGSVKNLKLENIQVNNTGDDTNNTEDNSGCIAAKVTSNGSIENCHVLGINSFVLGNANTGGLAGNIDNGGKMTNCTSSAFVSGTKESTELIVGKNGGTDNITNCISTGTVISKK